MDEICAPREQKVLNPVVPHLEGVLRDVHHDGGEETRHVHAPAHHPDETLQPVQLLARVGGAQELVEVAALLLDLFFFGRC